MGGGGTRYEVTAITWERFFGFDTVWLNERDQVAIFDRERSLLDAFQHFHMVGSLSAGLEALEEHLGELDLDRLALQLGVTTVVKRLGWALEQQSVPEGCWRRSAPTLPVEMPRSTQASQPAAGTTQRGG